jgi:hypothetical protein
VGISAARVPAYAAGFLSWLVLSLGGRGAGVSRRIAASLATAAGSSIRSGNPCLTRDRLASSAPALRTASRSWSVMAGCGAGARRSVFVPSFVPLPAFARLRVDTRSMTTVGDEVEGSLSASARADGAAIRADAREAVHLHFALPVTDSHLAARQWPRAIWTV